MLGCYASVTKGRTGRQQTNALCTAYRPTALCIGYTEVFQKLSVGDDWHLGGGTPSGSRAAPLVEDLEAKLPKAEYFRVPYPTVTFASNLAH